MFDIVRNNRKLIQLVLALIMLPFVFFGVDSYFRDMGRGADPASVGDAKISAQEFQQALREQQERLRPALGGRDPSMLDNPELRRGVLEQLVNQRLISVHVVKSKMTLGDMQLAQYISSSPMLQEDGKFSPQRYKQVVAAQGMSEEMFEARVRQDLVMKQALEAVAEAAVPGRAAADRWIGAQLEEREVAEALLRPEHYTAQVKLADGAVKAFYEANRKRFEMPEQVRAEFVVLSLEKQVEKTTVSDEDAKAWYQANADRFKQPEERRASHILITANKGAPDAQVKAAQEKIEEVAAQLKKSPNEFAKLAKQHSQDPGSAANGGDLGWFGRGAMVPPFEQATFALKENEISGIVRSDFGFHIIRLAGIRAERVKPFDEVRKEIVDMLKREAATKKYAEMVESFSNTVYEQADSLKPVAEKFGLEVRTSDWLTRGGQAVPPFTNPKLMGALFGDDALKNKRNTEAVEVAANTLVAARVVEHRPAMLQPLEGMAPTIEKLLVREEAGKLAAKDGEARLARLQKGESAELVWGQARSVLRSHAPTLPPDAVRAIFRTDASKLPAYAGVAVPGGYALFRISQVKPLASAGDDVPRARALRDQYARIVADEEFAAWLATLRQRYPVTINKAALEAKVQ